MKKKKLQVLLDSGAITQEEYDELAKTATDDLPGAEDTPGEKNEGGVSGFNESKGNQSGDNARTRSSVIRRTSL